MTPTRRPLPVPDEALDAWNRFTRAPPLARVPTIENMSAAVTAIATPVVAAVLDDLADQMEAEGLPYAVSRMVRARAEEYRGGGG